jgi:hypothetical protein
MPNYIERRLSRTQRRVIQLADVPTTVLSVDIKIDSSQQFLLYGVTFGIEFLLAADRGLLLFMPCFAVLNFEVSQVTGVVLPPLNESLDMPFYDSITDGADSVKSIDYSNPVVINGDRSVTFFLHPPFTSAGLGGTPTFILTVRGEVTQISDDDKPRYGNWRPR